ncbi:hypothetical protein O181_024637 [Austropuccinia psidii MF-1]|uniref:Uncharacterized protein n=1 Tax=Austropuccinia psidii MF-1 TaxID=1389203 RepID=A0A9Q3CLW5_9BASI|nr:hypothetical protein [Austropuccinia psidii MF-1]
MGGYSEGELDIITRTLKTFQKPLRRLQLTRLTQGETTSVAVYEAKMTGIFQEEKPENLAISIDDGGINGHRSICQHKKLKYNLLIRIFFWGYAVKLERKPFRIEEDQNLHFAPALDILGNVVSLGGRNILKQEINNIKRWPIPTTKKEFRGFLGLCAYVRMFMNNFLQVSATLRRFTREDELWKSDEISEEAYIKPRKTVEEEIP